MGELVQNLIDGLGRGSVYALLALGIALIFGVMHLVNFAHGELITVSAYMAYWGLVSWSSNWWVAALMVIVASMFTAVAIEFVAFRWVRGGSEFTMLLTSFGVHFVVQAIFVMYVGANVKNFPRPGWIADVWTVGGVLSARVPAARIDVRLLGGAAAVLASAWLIPVVSLSTVAVLGFLLLSAASRSLLNTIVFALARLAVPSEALAAPIVGVMNVAWATMALAAPLAAGVAIGGAGARWAFVVTAAAAFAVAAWMLAPRRAALA